MFYKAKGFTRGSGCYTCTCCGRKTRDSGTGDSVHLRMCPQCYELGGIENQIQDEGDPDGKLAVECEALKATIRAKGGTIN